VPLPQASAEHYREQQRLTLLTVASARSVWSGMTGDFDSSWQRIGPRLLMLLSAAQLGAARQGAAYVPLVLDEQGIDVPAVGQPVPRAFAGVASDGRPLDSLLRGAVTTAKIAVRGGAEPVEALRRSGQWLDMVFQTQVADAARDAAGVGIAARQTVGWVRMVNPPCCSRCAVLAGRFYRWSSGFQRHPKCDCRHIPTTENLAGDVRTDPAALVRSGQVTGLSKAERAALDEGSDLGQVVNSRRGRANDGITTTEGITRRRGQPARLTPAGIYRQAGGDREQAQRLLRENGYLI
jgi:hypothetical protein